MFTPERLIEIADHLDSLRDGQDDDMGNILQDAETVVRASADFLSTDTSKRKGKVDTTPLEEAGYKIMCTGGGCSAWTKAITINGIKGMYYIGDDADADIDEDSDCIGFDWMSDCGEHVFSGYVPNKNGTEAVALLIDYGNAGCPKTFPGIDYDGGYPDAPALRNYPDNGVLIVSMIPDGTQIEDNRGNVWTSAWDHPGCLNWTCSKYKTTIVSATPWWSNDREVDVQITDDKGRVTGDAASFELLHPNANGTDDEFDVESYRDAYAKSLLPHLDRAAAHADVTFLLSALDTAEHRFWASIASSYPEAKSGDLDPHMAFKTRDAMRTAVMAWVAANV